MRTQYHLLYLLLLWPLLGSSAPAERQRILAITIPLADHYAGIVAYEKYRERMEFADYQLKMLPGPGLVRAYFRSEPDADIAFNVSPMVMDMFAKQPDFRWVSLIHRDGNALAINDVLNRQANLPADRLARRADATVAEAISQFKQQQGKPIEIGIPSPLATHTTILYKYLKKHGRTFSFNSRGDADVVLKVIKPPKSPLFLKKKAARSQPAAFEQSLPWAEVVESGGFGKVGWYSKDVMQHEHGHVECIIIAKDSVIANKRAALQEVVEYIHQAGRDIELARQHGGQPLEEIVAMIRKHIPAHSREAIIQSLRSDLNVINYQNLNVDDNAKRSFHEIMELAHEAGFIQRRIDIDQLADGSFSTQTTINPD